MGLPPPLWGRVGWGVGYAGEIEDNRDRVLRISGRCRRGSR